MGRFQIKRAKVSRPRKIAFIRTVSQRERVAKTLRKAIIWGSTITAGLIIVSAIASVFFYSHYSDIVERRVNAGFWQTRAGMYAAPYKIAKGQHVAPDTVIDLLRRAGYIEGGAAWTGSFERNGNELSITTSNAYSLEPETTVIKFDGRRVAEIRQNGVLADAYEIESEMLTGRSETKRGKNQVLKFEQIPENLRNAIIAAEDQRFFEHSGIDPRGIARAALANITGGEIRQGGSTITQQLVKNTFLTPERSFTRKFAEAFLAIALERKMSKEDIFAVYCNEIYLGQYGASGVHGVEQAARTYFGKELKDLDLAQAVTIAAMIKNPRHFAPHKNAQAASERRQAILARMAELGFTSAANVEIARATEIKLTAPKPSDRAIAPYFVDAAMRELEGRFKNDYLNSNLNTRVYTTIDTQMQAVAERAVAKHLEGLDAVYSKVAPSKAKGASSGAIANRKSQSANRRLQAVIVAIDPHTGHILAMVGGRDYRESQFNRATDALRQPGSTFKPFVYATAYERGYSPITVSADRPTEFGTIGGKPYKPANFHDGYTMTNITLKSALVRSSNVVAVRTAMDVGLGQVAAKARDFGFENVTAWPSMALGTLEATPLQIAAAYAAFANGGVRVNPTFIDRVVSGDDSLVYISTPDGRQVIKEQTAYLVTDALTDVVRRGTAAKANGALGDGVVFAGKTGTTKDGWFVGYTPNLVTVAWIGLDDNQDLHAQASDIALPLWVDFMREALKLRPEYGGDRFPMPAGLTEIVVDPENGMAAGPYCPQREKAVVPTSAATYFKCLRHEPLETMFAMADSHETDESFETITIDIPPAYVEPNADRRIERDLERLDRFERRDLSRRPERRIEYDEYSDDDDELMIRRPRGRDRDDDDPDDGTLN